MANYRLRNHTRTAHQDLVVFLGILTLAEIRAKPERTEI